VRSFGRPPAVAGPEPHRERPDAAEAAGGYLVHQDSDGGARFRIDALRAASGLIVTAIVVTTLGTLLHVALNPIHAARSRLLLRPAVSAAALRPLETFRPTASVSGLDLSAETESMVLTSPLVASRVARALRLDTQAERLSRAVTATPVTDTLIEVQASVDDPVLAARLANGFADQYLVYRRESTARIVVDLQRNLGRRASRLQARIDRLNSRIAALQRLGSQTGATGRTLQSVVAQRDDLVATASVLQTGATELQALGILSSSGGDVIQRAPPARDSGALPAGALGILLGGILGVVLVLLRAVVEPPAGAKAAGGLPVLVTIPQTSEREEPVLLREPESAAAATYRFLRSALQARGLGASRRRVLVVPAQPGQRASAAVANLAVACAQSGLRTVVVAAGVGGGGAPAMLGGKARHGSHATLEGGVPWLGRLVVTGTVNLCVLPAGPTTTELLAILDEAARLFDVILIDAPPVEAGDGTLTLAERCELALLVAPAPPALPVAAEDAGRALEQVLHLVTGLVLVNATAPAAKGRSTAIRAVVDRALHSEPRGGVARLWWYVPVVLAGVGSEWGGPGIAVLAILGVVALLAVLQVRAWAWAATALGLTTLTFLFNRAGLVPDIVTFAHFPVVYLGLAAVLFRSRGQWPPVARRLALALALLLLAACMSAVLNQTEALRPLVTIGIWAEPFVLLLLLLLEPPSERERIVLLVLFGVFVILQLPFGVAQALTLGVGDTVKGTLNGAHDMAAFTVLGSLILLSWASDRSVSIGLTCLLAALPFFGLLPVLADAKQVIFALPAAAMVLFLTTRRLSWRLVIAAVLTGTLTVLLIFIPAGNLAVESITDAVGGNSGKAVGFDIAVGAMGGEWVYPVFGLGPANGLSRTAFLTADNHALRSSAPLRRFHFRPAPIFEQARAQAAVLAGATSKDTSFNLPISSMLGIFTDLGIVGLLAFGWLLAVIMVPLTAMRRHWLARAALAGWTMSIPLAFTFDWWEQPPYMIQLALLAGLAISASLSSRGATQEKTLS
jgi:Mrp family chromosome partitioning ATPase